MENEGLNYSGLAARFKKRGRPTEEGTIRSWLLGKGHIVGPHYKNLKNIAYVIQDPYLTNNVDTCCEACRYVKRDRGWILNLIAESINMKLTGNIIDGKSELKAVYSNIEKLFETKELKNIVKLDESVNVKVSLANRSIKGTEVIL